MSSCLRAITRTQLDRLFGCVRVDITRRVAVCGDIGAAGGTVHRHPPVLPATRLRTPRRGAAASASLNNKTRSMAGAFLPI
ncbi:jg6890 [Pararge aegeria aegeria]|uniref:Jg6890 protein n=1 Tax=Pararge aegeria aegeria TaxID=348720 RepID=A0A8S4RQP0_9NEOP|nr:jg6890 [Pararge aegeria aegeria]